MLGELEQTARELGLSELRLGTHRSLGEAIAMYRSLGYLTAPDGLQLTLFEELPTPSSGVADRSGRDGVH
jgi:hypothetical protein